MKKCSKCAMTLDLSNFHYNKGKPRSRCKMCMREDLREHYQRNKLDYAVRSKEVRYRLRQFIKTLKETTPCADCGVFYPSYVMDFDHKFDKRALVSEMVSMGSMKKLKEEIAKCDIVCSNCHRIRTHRH
jgi:hypothetical protein